jgi:ABC-type dipeptide/oligopeptide/nickel transport system permease component
MLITGHWAFELMVFGVAFALVTSPLLAMLNGRGERSRRTTMVFCSLLAAIPMAWVVWVSWVWLLDSLENSCGFILLDGRLTAYGWAAGAIQVAGYALIGAAWGFIYHWLRSSDAAIDGRT